MRNIWTIAQREMLGYFTSPMAYAAMLFMLGTCGLIFVLSTAQTGAKADMTGMFHSMVFLSLLMCPVITMGLLAQETNSGTYELLMTRPVRDAEVVVGKFLGAFGLYLAIVLISLEFALIFERFGQPDWGQILSGYIGLLLAGMAFLAVGVFTSSLTSNQIAAWLMGLILLLFFWLVGWIGTGATNLLGDIAKSLSSYENFGDLEKGVIASRSVIYFLSLIGFFLFLATRSLESRRTV
ncbi:MAG: ABC transporter permease [Armatimonadetes bacterium]|nr:ABC transporter permease [Armatimonadota bacterium]